MLKRVICLSAALCMLLSIASADTSQQLRWATEAAQECALLAGSGGYLGGVMGRSSEQIGMAFAWSFGDYATPDAVYRFTTDLDIYIIAERGVSGVTEEQIPYLRWMASTVTPYGYLDIDTIMIISACQAVKSFVGECGCEWWLLSYDDGCDVLVTFKPYDNGMVTCNATFWHAEEGMHAVDSVYEMLQSVYGMVACERIQ